MNQGDTFVFHWTADAAVAVDMHGERVDAAKDEYTSYWIEREQSEASGTFTAPFDGSHGWYWLNRGDTPVTVQVDIKIGRAHVCTPVTNEPIVCRLLLEKKKPTIHLLTLIDH